MEGWEAGQGWVIETYQFLGWVEAHDLKKEREEEGRDIVEKTGEASVRKAKQDVSRS